MTIKNSPPLLSKHPEIIKNKEEAGNLLLRAQNHAAVAGDALNALLAKMRRVLSESGGVGIAAPQIGVNLRVALVQRFDKAERPIEAMLNPRVVAWGEATEADYEGCLSVPDGVGKVARSTDIEVEYADEQGAAVREVLSGFTARIFQHELDHLEGQLFIDKMTPEPLISLEDYAVIKEKRAARLNG